MGGVYHCIALVHSLSTHLDNGIPQGKLPGITPLRLIWRTDFIHTPGVAGSATAMQSDHLQSKTRLYHTFQPLWSLKGARYSNQRFC
jgi:hypothetical protein